MHEDEERRTRRDAWYVLVLLALVATVVGVMWTWHGS